MTKKYYAVKIGKKIGIYDSWEECKKQVIGFSGAKYKSFLSLKDAENYLYDNNLNVEISDGCYAKAYVDGSYNPKSKVYGYGAVLILGESEYEFSGFDNEKDKSEMRNVSGELMGVVEIIKYCIEQNINSINIYYDYMGIECWANGEWKTNKTYTREYAEFIRKSRTYIDITFSKVKAHSGDYYNEIVDKLAKKAVGI